MYNHITGIILSGGNSSRMGQNKSFLKLGGISVIDRTIAVMQSLFSENIIISNEPELYEYCGLKIYEDIYKGVGPIAGIHSGLMHSSTEKNFIISCDIPLMNNEMIASIVEYPSATAITLPKADGFIQNLCGLYSKRLISIIEKIIRFDIESEIRDAEQVKRKCKLTKLIETVQSTIIEDITTLKGYFPGIFINMNSSEDYHFIMNHYVL